MWKTSRLVSGLFFFTPADRYGAGRANQLQYTVLSDLRRSIQCTVLPSSAKRRRTAEVSTPEEQAGKEKKKYHRNWENKNCTQGL